MKAILYVVAILIIGVATYFTLEHTRKFEELQTIRLDTIKRNTIVSADADDTEKVLVKEKKTLADAKQKRTELEESISNLVSNGNTLKKDVEGLDGTLKEQAVEFDQLAKTMEQVNKILKELVDDADGEEITLDNLGEKMEAIEEDKKARQAKVEELDTLVGAAEKLLAKNRADLDRWVKRDVDRSARIGRNAMVSRVTAVDQDWGYIVIGAGSNSGFTPQTSLIVQRDGRIVARVNPSSIEPTQTIAEIDFKSLAPGARIQPGDRVILAKPNSN